jgi:predicted alpha/beta hydrolase family esterase
MDGRVLFVQGGGAGVHDEWDDKLVRSLERELGSHVRIRYPRMPDEENPGYAPWRAALEPELAALGGEAILVGHSVGGAVLVSTLAEQPGALRFGALFLLAAPFFGDGGWPSDELTLAADLGSRLPTGAPVFIYQGLEDEIVPPSHADLYARAIPQASVHRLPDRDHQFNDDLREVAATIRSLERAA